MSKPNPNPRSVAPKPPIPQAVSPGEETPRPPLWETLSMVAAFVLLWVWFSAHKAAQNAHTPLGPEWTALLLGTLALMAFILFRRVRRFQRALEETRQQMGRGPRAMPWMPPDRNGHN